MKGPSEGSKGESNLEEGKSFNLGRPSHRRVCRVPMTHSFLGGGSLCTTFPPGQYSYFS